MNGWSQVPFALRAALAALLFAAHPVYAVQTLADEGDVRKLVDSAMASVGAGRIEEGMQRLQPYWLLRDQAALPEFVLQTTAKLLKAEPVYGKPVGWEFLGERRAGNAFRRLGYLQRFQNYAVAWDVSLYHSPRGWLVNEVTFHDTLDPLFVAADCTHTAPKARSAAGDPVPAVYPDPEVARDALDAAMAALAEGDAKGAAAQLQAFKGNMSRFQDLFTGWDTVKSPTVHADSRSLGIERVLDARVAQSLVRYTYLHRYEQDAVRWFATLYRRPEGWNLVNLAYSTDMDPLFETTGCAMEDAGR